LTARRLPSAPPAIDVADQEGAPILSSAGPVSSTTRSEARAAAVIRRDDVPITNGELG
jgi:hypothetical protein